MIQKPVRFITASSLFDGHDVSINLIRRLLIKKGAEVIHLGHNRSVHEVVKAAIEEDVDAIAISSYQGGHVEYFSYMLELLKKENAQHIKIFGGGGGVIVPKEISKLENLGICKIFSPEDGQVLGLLGMIDFMMEKASTHAAKEDNGKLSRRISLLEDGYSFNIKQKKCPIIGFTGTGGAGKSSLIDEILLRFLRSFSDKKVGVLSVDPTRMKTKGALLGDRIRVNQASDERVFLRSLATKDFNQSISKITKDALLLMASEDFDLVMLETSGIGQADASIKDICDVRVYVMTPEYGAQSQLEKIAMFDYADFIVINKFDRSRAQDALKDAQKAYQRSQELFSKNLNEMPVFGTCAHIFNDLGVNAFFNHLMKKLDFSFSFLQEGSFNYKPLIPKDRQNYLGQISKCVEDYHNYIEKQANQEPDTCIENKINEFLENQKKYKEDEKNYNISLSGLKIPKVMVPEDLSKKDLIKFIGKENLPGFFPYTLGVFPFKRQNEDPTRMFAGEGFAERTNKRFHYLSKDQKSIRLSTAFDSVTLYGENPHVRPDIFGKIGNAGVSVFCLDDVKRLYSGFDLSSINTSVSMTINGPAPIMLAYFFNAAIDFAVEKELRVLGLYEKTKEKIDKFFKDQNLTKPVYRADLPENHNGHGLMFLGLPSDLIVEKELYERVKKDTLKIIRGTIQADILKEDQAQNTCIFSIGFSLLMMGHIQKYFIENSINNFYSVSISGYHIAEAGANPISQLAFTLANGFTLLEYYLSLGMKVDDFAKNFSFFFSNGIDPEYAVIGRVARRIWAIALKNIYKANDRSQKLKYHIQTSGRSLHAQEIDFNDIRTTLQAFYAILDNCNSLHTNAFDEAITTPTESSVRKAMAIQLILNHELGLLKNENSLSGSYFLSYLTDLVEKKVLEEFNRLDERGGVLGAMETMYQRSVIQEESLYYEEKKHSGEYPIIGINTFIKKAENNNKEIELIRSTLEEKNHQIEQASILGKIFIKEREKVLENLKSYTLNNKNIFSSLVEATKYCTLGEITKTLYGLGGSYRRAM